MGNKSIKKVSESRKQTGFRLPEDLLDRLAKEAYKQTRSVNNLVETTLDKHIPKTKNVWYNPSGIYINVILRGLRLGNTKS